MHLELNENSQRLPFFAGRISSETVLTSVSRREGDLFVGEVDSELFAAHAYNGNPEATEHIAKEQVLARTFQN